MTEELKPCPFTGERPVFSMWTPSDGRHRDYAAGVWIATIASSEISIEKSSRGGEEDAKSAAIAAWNRRATLSPAHIEDGEEVEVVGTLIIGEQGWDNAVELNPGPVMALADAHPKSAMPLMTVAQHQRIVAALSADNQRVVPPEPILAAPHPMAALYAPPAADMTAAYVGAREDLAIWKHRALEAEQKVRVLDQRIDQLVLEAQGETRMGEPHIAPPAAVPAELTNVRCMCGDEYPHDSYGAGFIAGSGMCENCDAAIPAKEPPAAGVPEGWQPMETAPKDGTLLRLLVEFEDHPIDDGAGPFATVGTNYRDNTGEDAWQIVGWCWEQDRFIDGVGTPIGWLPMLAATPTPPASEQQRAVFAIPDMDEHLLQILGRPNFRCAHIAQVLRLDGAEIRRKAEDEQAVVIHWMLTLYLAHGAKWWEVATEEVKRIQSEHMAKGEGV